MANFIECQDCGFVLLSESPTEPVPRGDRDSCPDCGEANFRFTDG